MEASRKPLVACKKGYLTKEGGKYKNWKRRWFILQESTEGSGCLSLSYFTNEQEKDILGVIDLKQCEGIRKLQHERDGKKNILHILCKHRDYFLSADTKQQQEDWYDMLDVLLKTHNLSSESEIEMKMGYLVKQGKSRKSWKKRWFVLENSIVTYYKAEADKKPLGRFTLADCIGIQQVDEEKAKRTFAFEILTPDRTYLISALSEDERIDWMEALEDSIPEAGKGTQSEPDQIFDNDEDGNSDDEEETEQPIFHNFASNRKFRRKKRLTMMADLPIAKQGPLIKQGGFYKSFKERWFVLQGTSLYYFKDQKDKKPLGIISLENCSGLRLVDDSKSKRTHCFEVNTAERIYLIQAASEEDRNEWILAIEDAVPEGLIDEEELPLESGDIKKEEKREDISSAKHSLDLDTEEDDSDEEIGEVQNLKLKGKSGWLLKEGGQHKAKKKRWFVLEGFFLYYFKTDKDKTPAGTIDLKSSKGVNVLDGTGKVWPFEIATIDRNYYIEADSEALREEWLQVLNEVYSAIKPKTGKFEGEVIKRGFLEKRGGRNQGWRKRFFVLDGSTVRYFKDEKESKLMGTIDLGLCRGLRKTPSHKSSRPNSFEVLTPHRIFQISAETQEEAESWLEFLADGVPDDPSPKALKKTPTTAEDLNAVRLGFLHKLDNNSTRWHRRWFALKNESQLLGYRDEQDTNPIMTIELSRCTSIQEAPPKIFDRKNVFTVHLTGGKVLVLSSPTSDDAEDWIDVLGDSVPEDADLPTFDVEEGEQPILQGFLTKQGGNRKSWKRRWFVFKGNTISYHKKKNDSEELGVINLRALTEAGSSIKEELALEIPNGFAIITPERTFYLGADSPQARAKWVEALKNYLQSKKGNSGAIESC